MRVQVIKETMTADPKLTKNWELCFQWCLYVYDDGSTENGYRFIWRRSDGSLQPARGQARLPSIPQAIRLMADAMEQGWGNNTA